MSRTIVEIVGTIFAQSKPCATPAQSNNHARTLEFAIYGVLRGTPGGGINARPCVLTSMRIKENQRESLPK